MHDLTRGPSPLEYTSGTLQAVTARSLQAERDLAQALLSFTNVLDAAEEEYLHQWGLAIHPFDPSDLSPESCSQLPTFAKTTSR